MKLRLSILIAVTVLLLMVFFILVIQTHKTSSWAFSKLESNSEETPAVYTKLRAKYEFDMIKDPFSGTIPRTIFEKEIAMAKKIPTRGNTGSLLNNPTALNTYLPAGPNNIGGRTRAFAYDVRYDGTTNKVLMAGSVSGGIMRSIDGGLNWTRVSPENEIHNVTAIVQDPRAGNQNTWYAGGGEPYGNTASEIGASYLGFGIHKSLDNGATWTRLTLTVTDINGTSILPTGTLETFDNSFDFVHKLLVDPANGNLYVAGHRRLVRSTDGGNTFNVVFVGTVAAVSTAGQIDIIKAGSKLMIAVNGGNPDPLTRGVWTSTTGNANSWTRIAGGSVLGTDSVANWRANSYSVFSGSSTPVPKRILLAAAPSNPNIVYVCYENGLSNTAPDNAPEADLFKLDMTTTNVWTNLSANMPDFPGSHPATDPFATQDGYDLFVAVKPDNPNFVLVGGTSLYRSTDGFSSTANTTWIGGYGTNPSLLSIYPNSHPDMHLAVFNPSNPNEAIAANDGGLQITTDISKAGSGGVVWAMVSKYQTLQYNHVSIDPGIGRNNFIGGSQDNGTHFRDKTGLFGSIPDSNNHVRILGGDGCYTGYPPVGSNFQFLYLGVQLGSLYRSKLAPLGSEALDNITPAGLTPAGGGGFGEFVTNFRLDQDNTEDLYYVNFNRLFRTTTASTVTASTWTELTGVGQTVNPANPTAGTNIGIRAMAFSRGPYTTSHVMYVGTTAGKIFRLNDPRNSLASSAPVDITPASLPAGANIQDIAVNPNNDDELMAVVSNYVIGTSAVTSIWWTKNAKAGTPTWRNAEGNLGLPSIRSCMIVVKKDASNNPVTEYYVGTSVGLYSAVNIDPILTGGGTVTWQREGGNVLNFSIVQSLAYRPADNVMVVGTHGNGMYYTFLGTPNFVPNQNTGTIDPIVNDKKFIKAVYPTISSNLVQFKIGNLFTTRKLSLQLFSMSGQEVIHKELGYQDGSLDISTLQNGAYILSIYSDDRKNRHIQKIIKQ